MASDRKRQELATAVNRISNIGSAELLRKNFGDQSLEGDFSRDLDEINKLAAFARQHAAIVHDSHVSQAIQTLNNLANAMEAQAARSPAEYISYRQNFMDTVRQQIEEATLWRPIFAGSAVLERGFLEDEGIRQEYERVVTELNERAEATLAQVKKQADDAVAEAEKLAEEIEARARKSATKMSVEEAQTQFSEATKELQEKVKTWGWWAVGSVCVLLGLPLVFMYWPLPGEDTWPVALYHTLLRVFMLSAAGAAVTVCVRLYRAHLHMIEKNRHRVRVANSIESFVNSALEPQQRDLLLAKLAEAVIDFGDPGITKRERDESPSSTVSGDLVGRILAALRPGSAS